MLMMQSGPSRGIAAASSAGVGGSSADLLTLNAALDGTAGYRYIDFASGGSNYVGAFRFSDDTGEFNLAYCDSTATAISPDGTQIFLMDGSTIGSFTLPTPSTSASLSALPIADNARTAFNIRSFIASDNDDWGANGFRAGGLCAYNGMVMGGAFGAYDSENTVDQTHFVVTAGNAIASGGLRGFFKETHRGHACGWISEIPDEYKAAIGATHLCGLSSGNSRSINSRFSIGPSAFPYDADQSSSIVGATPISNGASFSFANALMDFTLANPVCGDPDAFDPTSGSNDPTDTIGSNFTALSEAYFGGIIPGTRTYMVVGNSGGMTSGTDYGVPAWGGGSGYHPVTRYDMNNHCWLFDVDDLLAVKAGTINAYDVRPYEHGPIVLPFQGTPDHGSQWGHIFGAYYDIPSDRLYLILHHADDSRATESPWPLALVYGGLAV